MKKIFLFLFCVLAGLTGHLQCADSDPTERLTVEELLECGLGASAGAAATAEAAGGHEQAAEQEAGAEYDENLAAERRAEALGKIIADARRAEDELARIEGARAAPFLKETLKQIERESVARRTRSSRSRERHLRDRDFRAQSSLREARAGKKTSPKKSPRGSRRGLF